MTIETLDTRSLKMLAVELVKEEDRRAEILLSGSADSLEDYRGQVEFLRGLRFARKLCGEIETEIRKGK
jgi:hypothetical protein